MRHNWIKHFAILSMLIMPVFSADAATPNFAGMLEEKLETPDLQVFFDPAVVEEVLKGHFSSTDLGKARQKFDELATQKQGFLSAEDLFLVCWAAWGSKTYHDLRKSMLSQQALAEAKKQVWAKCEPGFIHDMLDYTKEVQEVYSIATDTDYTTKGGPCTPPKKDPTNWTPNRYCNFDEYNFDPAFQKAMITKFRLEGGCAKAKDENGMTCFGISEKYNVDAMDKPDFSRRDAMKIAYDKYYHTNGIHLLPDSIVTDVFWTSFDSGPTIAVKTLQRIVGADIKDFSVDGIIGKKQSIPAVQNYKGLDLRKQYIAANWARMKRLGNFEANKQGWANGRLLYLENGCHSPVAEKDKLEASPETTKDCGETRDPVKYPFMLPENRERNQKYL